MTIMKLALRAAVISGATMVGAIGTALTINFDCVISGGGLNNGGQNCVNKISAGPFGSLVFTDNGDGTEHVSISNFGTSPKILKLLFNYGAPPTTDGQLNAPAQSTFSGTSTLDAGFATGAGSKIGYTQDTYQADGLQSVLFDIDIPIQGNFGEDAPFAFDLSGNNGGLLAPFFRSFDNTATLWAAIHLGADDFCTGSNGCVNDNQSIWLGALVGSGTEIPEPTTLLLLATGLLGLAGIARWHRAA
jgi:hypothetical protein